MKTICLAYCENNSSKKSAPPSKKFFFECNLLDWLIRLSPWTAL